MFAVVIYKMLMTSKELDSAIRQIGCTGSQLAKWLGVTPVTVSNWRTARHEVPGPVAVAVESLATGWRPTHPKIGGSHEQ